MKWERITSTTTFQDRYIHLRTDRCRKPDGSEIPNFHVLEYGTWVNAVVLDADFHCVLVREYRHGIGEVRVGLPGGGMDQADAHSLQAAKREVLEETGYSSPLWFPLGTLDVNSSSHNNRLESFVALDAVQTTTQNLDPNEAIEILKVRFVDLVLQLKRNEIALQALHAAPLWAAVSWILSSDVQRLEPLKDEILRILVA